LAFNCGKFAIIKNRIVYPLPDAKKLNRVPVAQPIRNKEISMCVYCQSKKAAQPALHPVQRPLHIGHHSRETYALPAHSIPFPPEKAATSHTEPQ
jgi:hypothetical protein